MEALELPPNRPMSFLNIGSGTGYISSIAAQIMGPTSTQYGVELHAEVLEHCEEAMAEWQQSRVRAGEERPAHVEILHGNGLNIDGTQGEALVGLDRIYIGAAIEKNDLAPIAALLKPGGILVGPGKLDGASSLSSSCKTLIYGFVLFRSRRRAGQGCSSEHRCIGYWRP